MKRALPATLFFLALLALWQLATWSGRWSPVLLPSPLHVAEYLTAALQDGTLIEAIWVTMRRLLAGYLIGVVLGLPLGLAVSSSQLLKDTLGALALGLQTLPSVCWVPLALLWFGQSEGAMLFVVVMGTVWSVIIATDHGARNIPPIYARAARTMGSEGLHQWTRVILPASLPFLVSGMKQGWAFAWRSLMAAELITYSPSLGQGLGQLLNIGRELSQMSLVITSIALILVVGVAIELLVFAPIERRVLLRRGLTIR